MRSSSEKRHTWHLGNYELPERYHDYKIVLIDDNSGELKVFNTNTVLLSQNSRFFRVLLKNKFSEKFKDEVHFISEIISEEAWVFILKWMHSHLLSQVKSLPKSRYAQTTKLRQKASIIELVAEKCQFSFPLFEHYCASNFLMMKDSYYEDLGSAITAILKPYNCLDLFGQVLEISQHFDSCEKIMTWVKNYISLHIFELDHFERFVSDYKENPEVEQVLQQGVHSLDIQDSDQVEKYIDLLMNFNEFDSVFELLESSRRFVYDKGDLMDKEPWLVFSIPFLDVNIALASDDAVFEYVKVKKGKSSLLWKIKAKINQNKQLGIFFSPRAFDDEGNLVNGVNSNSLVENNGLFRTAMYNIKIENSRLPVFKQHCSLYSFPLTENYFFGPSNIEETINILNYWQEEHKNSYEVKVWLMEWASHSVIMHYIGTNYSEVMDHCPIEHMKLIEPKEFISFLEWSRILNTVHPKKLLSIVNRYSIIKKLSQSALGEILATLKSEMFTHSILKQFIEDVKEFNQEYQCHSHSIVYHPKFIKMLGSQRQSIVESHD